jgi:hypothetical protein
MTLPPEVQMEITVAAAVNNVVLDEVIAAARQALDEGMDPVRLALDIEIAAEKLAHLGRLAAAYGTAVVRLAQSERPS